MIELMRLVGYVAIAFLLVLPPVGGAARVSSEAAAAADPTLHLIGQLGGASWAVAAGGNRAYLGVGLRVLALDISDPAHPALLGSSAPLGGLVRDMQLVGRYLYVAASEAGLQVIDVANPANPLLLGQLAIEGPPFAHSVFVSGARAFVLSEVLASAKMGNYEGQLTIVDISDPLHPTRLGYYTKPGYELYGLYVSGDHAFLSFYWGLIILDVSNAAAPIEASGLVTEDDVAYGVYVQGNYAYLGAFHRVYVIDVSDIEHPSQVTTIPVTGRDMLVRANYLYLIGEQLHVVDIATPAAPVVATSLALSGRAISSADGGAAGVACVAGDGLHVVSLANPRVPAPGGSYPILGSAQTLATSGSYAAVLANGLHIVDISTPTAPQGRGTLPTQATAVAVSGRYAYLAAGEEGLKVVSFSDATHPTLARTIDTPGDAVAVAVEGQRLYLGDGQSGLRIYDISTPGDPQLRSVLGIPTTRLQPMGSYLYTAFPYWEGNYDSLSSTLHAVNVADAQHPADVWSATISGGVEDMDLASGHLLVLHYQLAGGGIEGPEEATLSVWSLAQPASPSKAASYRFEPLGDPSQDGMDAHRLDVSGQYAYVAARYYRGLVYATLRESAVLALDISTVTAPVLADRWLVKDWGKNRAYDLQASGDTVYVADADAGLTVLRYQEAVEPTPTPTLMATPTPAPGCQVIPVSCDTYISSWYPQQNYAAAPYLALRQGNVAAPMLKFDTASLPPAASIGSARLNLHVRYRTNEASLLARLYGVRRQWVCSEATWQRASAAAAWAAPGCGDTTTDRDPTPEAEVTLDAENRWYSLNVTDLVRRWASNPSNNQGMILVGEGGVSVQYGLSAVEADDPGFAPRLVVCAAQPTPSATRTPGPTLPARVRLPMVVRQSAP